MVTTEEIKKKYTTIQDIDKRILEIKRFFKEDVYKYRIEWNNRYKVACSNLLKTILPDGWEVMSSEFDRSVILSNKNSIDSIEIFGYYEHSYKFKCDMWKFTMNPATCGSFNIISKDDKVRCYFLGISTLLTNTDVMIMLNDTMRDMSDEMVKYENEYVKPLDVELSILEVWKREVMFNDEQRKYVEAIKKVPEDDYIVLINKDTLGRGCVVTLRGNDVIIKSYPYPSHKIDLLKKIKLDKPIFANHKYTIVKVKSLKCKIS